MDNTHIAKKKLSAWNIIIIAILVIAVLFLVYKVISLIYIFTHPSVVRYPFYCENLDPSMSKEQIRRILEEKELDASVLIEKQRESWFISSERPIFSKADSLRGVVLIFQDDKYYSANEITFDGYRPLCTFP